MEKNYIKHIAPYLEELQELSAIPTGAKAELKPCVVKAVIFDLYGTLMISSSGDIDQADYNAQMIIRAFDAVGIALHDRGHNNVDRIHDKFNETIGAHKAQGRKEGRPFPEVNILEVWEETLEYFKSKKLIDYPSLPDLKLLTFIFELQTNKVWPMPNMKTVIKTLGESTLELGIVSNAQFYTPVIMNYFLNQELIDSRDIAPFNKALTVYSFENLRSKPDVTLFDTIVNNLIKKGIAPEEIAFVGNDMLKDTWTAKQAGLKTIFFAGDQRAYRLHPEDERTKNLKADYTITDLKQLLEILSLDKK